ncbi:DNA polymerase III subunit beta [Rhizobium sp. P32RR-XVIII]|uniref:DNA polymerase III subunit beta n=1 Tax=Rhizobium sp. P32RR-XVIII TaxID=2726738 RepID=UPI0014578989|nr:DNA polymerase III subunit beta [Rhizobium sp. P32RR-XVIII]NLS02291.1 DNA polymerase III subunit beta [Rhizobium sp. P32RR-XVIII]
MADVYFRVHRSQLLPALDAVSEAVDTKATIPILGNVLLRPSGDDLHLSATDLAVEIQTSCELLAGGTGDALTLSGPDLRDIVRKLPETAEIEFAAGSFSGQVRIQAGRSRFLLLSLPEGDFPTLADKIKGVAFDIDLAPMMSAIGKVTYAAKQDESRPYLAGVFVHPHKDGRGLAVVGCDGHNLAIARVEAEEVQEFKPPIIPLKAVKSMAKLFGDRKVKARLTVSDVMLRVQTEGVVFITKLVDGTYPDYARIIPQSNARRAILPVDSFSSAISRVCLVSKDLGKDTVRLGFSGNALNMTLTTQEGEEAAEDIGAEYDDEKIEIGFNGKYLVNMLQSIPSKDVEVWMLDAGSPAIFKPTIESNELYLLMPKRF